MAGSQARRDSNETESVKTAAWTKNPNLKGRIFFVPKKLGIRNGVCTGERRLRKQP